ncbi:MAG: molybdenum cofactor biosynthesis protein MoaE [Chloroflexota bacterium]
MIQVINEVISPPKVLDSLKADISGSVVIHLGIVRPSSGEKQVLSIEYQVENVQAEQEMASIAGDIRGKWEIQDIALCRRTGKLGLGEIILAAAISAPHRKEAFEACQYAVERLRGMTSLKKREVYEQ